MSRVFVVFLCFVGCIVAVSIAARRFENVSLSHPANPPDDWPRGMSAYSLVRDEFVPIIVTSDRSMKDGPTVDGTFVYTGKHPAPSLNSDDSATVYSVKFKKQVPFQRAEDGAVWCEWLGVYVARDDFQMKHATSMVFDEGNGLYVPVTPQPEWLVDLQR